MEEQTAVVIGATGLIGGYLVNELLNDEQFSIIRILVRKQLPIEHPKLQQQVIDFTNITDYKNKFGNGDVIFCCIGTTMKKVKGDKNAYTKIDHDIPAKAAEIGIAEGYKKFVIISSVGANANSSNFYLQLKGKTEDAIKQFPFESIYIVRPSMLLGKRKESRPVEKVGQILMKTFSFLLIGVIKKYQPVKASDVAKAMVAATKKEQPGIHILEYNEIKKLLTSIN